MRAMAPGAVSPAWSSLVSGVFTAAAQQPNTSPPDPWTEAAQRVERLSPNRFPAVPSGVRQKMIADGCRVPQLLTPRDTKLERDFGGFVRGYEPPPKPTNVISGEFAERGQHDWAALCSSKGRSVIRVYWSGLSTCQPSFKSRKDVDLLEDYTFAYSVARATIPQMREMARDSVENGESLHLP